MSIINCNKCGAQISEFNLTCPFCMSEHLPTQRNLKEGIDESDDPHSLWSTPQSNNIIIINRDTLNGITRAASEVLPYETIGFLFGERIKEGARITAYHSMQNVRERNIHSVIWDVMSEERVKEVARAFGRLIYIGSYHSHPYPNPSTISGNMDIGTALSKADANCIIKKRCDVELVIAIFPWEPWRLMPVSNDWEHVNGILTCNRTMKIGKSNGCMVNVAAYDMWTGRIGQSNLQLD